MMVEIIDYGGHIRSCLVPNKSGEQVDVVVGLDTIEDYQTKNRFFGCITGRYANRICKGAFKIGDKEYKLAINNGENALHGGPTGFHTRMWQFVNKIDTKDKLGICLKYVSKDGEEGFPGELTINVNYLVHKNSNTIEINYIASTNSVDGTIINLTNHSYWNLLNSNDLSKYSENSILYTHSVNLKCGFITPVNDKLIPTGALMSVRNTPFDFTKGFAKISKGINCEKNEQIAFGAGFDHNFVIDRAENEFRLRLYPFFLFSIFPFFLSLKVFYFILFYFDFRVKF